MESSALKILIIDDEESDYKCLRGIFDELVKSGEFLLAYRLSLFEGKKAVDDWKPDVTLLDLSFPDSNSEKTVHEIPLIADKTAVIILTGHEQEKVLWGKCIKAGAVNFLQKQHYFGLDQRKSFYHAIINSHLLYESRRKP